MMLLQKKPIQTEIDKKVSLEARLDKSVNEKITQFNSFKRLMSERRDKVEQDFADYCLDIEIKRSKLENEVGTLEERRKQAVRPLDREREAIEKAKNAKIQVIEELDRKMCLLAQYESELGQIKVNNEERDKVLKKLEKTFARQREKLEDEITTAWTETQNLQSERQQFNNLVKSVNEKLNNDKEALKEKDRALNVLIESNNKKALALARIEKRLESRQQALKITFDEINRQKYGKTN